MTPFVESVKDGVSSDVNSMTIGKINAMSMLFEYRMELYMKLKAGEEVEKLCYNFTKIISHYLMYTTIGRTDLVEFEVAVDARQKEYEKMIEI